MRRPITLLFLALISGIAVQYHLQIKAGILALVSAGLIVLLFLSWRRKAKGSTCQLLLLFSFVAVMGSWYFFAADHFHDPLERQVGQRVVLAGRVLTYQLKGDYGTQLLVRSQGHDRLLSLQGTFSAPEDLVGRKVQVSGMVEMPSGRRNPNTFDYRLYLQTKGIHVIISAWADDVTWDNQIDNPLANQLSHLKHHFAASLGQEMSPEAHSILLGMLFGDRSWMSDDLYDLFQKSGTAHILSVSGLHVGIVYLYISRILGNRKHLLFYGLCAVFLLFYAALAEFSPSVVRAVSMIMVHMVAKVTQQRYDFTCSASACALGMILWNPYALFHVGFQLSYLAIFCLAVCLPVLNRWADAIGEITGRDWLTALLRHLAPLLAIQVGMAPVTAYLFNYFSFAAFLANLPIVAISGLVIPVGISLLFLSLLGGVPFGIGAQAAELLVTIMVKVNELCSAAGIGYSVVTSPSPGALFLFYCLLFFLCSEYFRILFQRKKWQKVLLSVLVFLLLTVAVHGVLGEDRKTTALFFIDVGQGDGLHLRTAGGKNILIDGGGSLNYNVGKKVLLPYFLKNGVKTIDLAIATHHHDDHYLGFTQLCKELPVKSFATYEANQLRQDQILAETGLPPENLIYLVAGERIEVEEGIWIDILYPKRHGQDEYARLTQKDADENEISLLMKVTVQGLSVLMTGDMGFSGEEAILASEEGSALLKSDILKVGHHGSRYSTGDLFLETVDPQIAIFQVGKNNFGHPHPLVIEKCAKNDIMVYRNDEDGAIMIKLKPKENRWHIETMAPNSTLLGESIRN